MVTSNIESRNPMGRVYAENRSKTQKLLGVKGLIQNYIEYLAVRAVHQDRMKTVCESIHLYGAWHYQNQTPMETLLEYLYPELLL